MSSGSTQPWSRSRPRCGPFRPEKPPPRNRVQEEVLRQQRCAALSRKAFFIIDRMFDAVGVEEVEKDGKRTLKAKGVGTLMPLAVFWREFNRNSILAVRDQIEEHNAKCKKADGGDPLENAELVAGTFSVGHRMWGDVPEPTPPLDAPAPMDGVGKPKEAPPPAFAPAQTAKMQALDEMLKATEGLYDRKDEE